jgi:aspartyl protease family protein
MQARSHSTVLPSIWLAAILMIGGGFQSHEGPAQAHAGNDPPPVFAYATTELKSGGNGHFYVTARVNGNSIKAVVDTGASAVVLSYQDAERAGLKPRNLSYDVPVSTANGIAYGARVTLREVEIDTVSVDDVQGIVMPDGALQGTLLGMSFLGKLRSFQVENGRLILKN